MPVKGDGRAGRVILRNYARGWVVFLSLALSGLLHAEEPAKIRITTWNLEWFPNGSAHDATQEKQAQRIEAAADVLKKLNPDILLLQEMQIGRAHV